MRPPNVVLVITDDQGYGDLGCTGNPWLRTPHIDAFHRRSVRLADFHVSPLCTPTRGALMTGHRPVRNGAWATCWGRSILRRSEVTMAEVFAASGYRTGMFGKWHLGDNYPYRPQDRGFQHVVAHKGGGVGQTPDYWGNRYFGDTYFHNGVPQAHQGYCTDIWFDEALAFIEVSRGEPFFAYIATNAPHSPYLVADRYKEPYLGNEAIPEPAFYGMIANIDENFGRLERRLEELGLAEDTILIFMTDNGSSGGCVLDRQQYVTRGYNAGLRGKKASYYDGGHRVPFFVRWPAGGLGGGGEVRDLVLHIDLLPTIVELCGLRAPDGVTFDGRSAAPLLRAEVEELPDRVHFVQFRQHTEPPEMWRSAVITRRWRLIEGCELYDIGADPGQRCDVAAAHPEVVARLRGAHEAWWQEIGPGLEEYCPISLGHEAENPTRLCAMDVLGDVAWNQGHILLAQKSTGQWAVEVERPGRYRFTLRRWPEELGLALNAAVPPEEAARVPFTEGLACATIDPIRAWLGLFGQRWAATADGGQPAVAFEVELTRTGTTRLDAWFADRGGGERGAYYVTAERR
ncbi:MAG: arylsulfatase [Gemmatimonadota bacterium]